MKALLYFTLGGFFLLLAGQSYLMIWSADSYPNRIRYLIGICSASCGILLVATYLFLIRIHKKITATHLDQETFWSHVLSIKQ